MAVVLNISGHFSAHALEHIGQTHGTDTHHQVCVRTLVRIGHGDVQKLLFGLWATTRVSPKHRWGAPDWYIHRDFV